MSDTEASWRGYALGAGADDPRHAAFAAEFERLADPPALAAVWELALKLDLLRSERRWTQRSGPGDELTERRATGVSRVRVGEARNAARTAAAYRVGEPAADRIGALIENGVLDLEQNTTADPIATYVGLHARVLDEAYLAADVSAQQVHDQLARMSADTARRLLADLGQAQPGSVAAWQHEQTLAAHLQAHPYLALPARTAPSGAAAIAGNALRPGRGSTRRTRAGRPALRVLPGGAHVATRAGHGPMPVTDPALQPEGRRR